MDFPLLNRDVVQLEEPQRLTDEHGSPLLYRSVLFSCFLGILLSRC